MGGSNLINENIGLAIRDIRTNKNMTLKELAELTQLSVGYLSILERGLSNPTIANLHKICNALNITMANLLSNINFSNDLKVKRENRNVIFDSGTGVVYEALTEGDKNLLGIYMTVNNHDVNISNKHIVDELGYIISGSINITLGSETYHLTQGDSIYIPANVYHSFKKTSVEECVSIWVYPKG